MWLRGLKVPKFRCFSTTTEPEGPCILSPIPGPCSTNLMNEMSCYQNVSCLDLFINYENSIGNYLVDVDGNTFLDLTMNNGTIPLGYNHPKITKMFFTPENLIHFVNLPALEKYPATFWVSKIKKLIELASPKLPFLTTSMCGACANEKAMKSMMMAYQAKFRNFEPISEAHITSAVKNMEPGSTTLSILSFKGSNHGSETMGVLTASHCDGKTKADLPAFNWPIAKFPQYKYPLEEFSCYNEQQDNKCLTSVRELIEKGRNDGCSVAGVIVEPIQDSNNNEASDKFIKTLQKICKENCCYFCIDETNTGCGATGTLWSHEQINLPEPPDAVTFSKKTQLSGFFHNIELNPQDGSRLQSTWSGDPSKLFMYESILNVIEKDYLLCTVNDTGCCLKNQLVKLQQNHPFIENIRGKGTFLAFDLKCPGMRNEILNNLKNRGILVKSCGEKGIAIRPALIFNQDHVGIFIENLNGILCDYKKAPVLNKHRKKKIPKYKPPCPEPCPEPPCNPCKPPPLPTCGICSPKKKKPC